MNKRIQELMRQSMVEHQFDLRFSPEKFAELIVKECASYVDSAISEGGVDGRGLKEHFGVE
jgi:hypothetical protein